MKIFLCSIGEKTTELVRKKLDHFGFEVILLNDQESWFEKYKKFINIASKTGENCLRIDADIIPNSLIKEMQNWEDTDNLMVQGCAWDIYTNNFKEAVVYYSNKAIQIIKDNLDKINIDRPETSAWRLPQINPKTITDYNIVGIHGLGQRKEDIERHKQHREARGQKIDLEIINFICQN